MDHVKKGNLDGVRKCFQPNFLEKEDSLKRRPIHWGIREGQLEIVKFLVQNKCSIECENIAKRRPFHHACWYGHLEIVKFLIPNECSIECEDKNKWRPIHCAAWRGYLEVVKFLCENQCELNCITGDGETPLDVAKRNGKKNCENYLNEVLKSRFRNEMVLAIQEKTAEQKQEFERITESQSKRFDERSNELESILKEIGTRLDNLVKENIAIKSLITKLSQVQASENYGKYVWCINNCKEELKLTQDQTEKIIFSDPFYSYKNGYKMCLELIPVADIDGRGPYLSLYVCIMQGEYDNILQWPFQHGVRLELLDQESGKAHVRKTVEYKQQTSHVAWQKPTKQRNTGSGFADFIKLSELSSNNALCRNNQIWIKATFLKL